jgi:hypothetical protein
MGVHLVFSPQNLTHSQLGMGKILRMKYTRFCAILSSPFIDRTFVLFYNSLNNELFAAREQIRAGSACGSSST